MCNCRWAEGVEVPIGAQACLRHAVLLSVGVVVLRTYVLRSFGDQVEAPNCRNGNALWSRLELVWLVPHAFLCPSQTQVMPYATLMP